MDFRRLFDILPYQEGNYPQKTALAGKAGSAWQYHSTASCLRDVDRLSAGLLSLGLKKGEKAAIITHIGSPEWNLLDFAMQQIGIIVVPVHATYSQEQLEFILHDAEVKSCFVSTADLLGQVQKARTKYPFLQSIHTFEKIADTPHFSDLLKEPTDEQLANFQALKASIHEDDLATIIYTSGTSGEPKGVMLSHKNIVSNIKSIMPLIPVNCDKRALSFLPLSHVFERMVTYTYMAVGASIYYAAQIETIVEDLRTVRPHYFTTVPRLLEKMYESIEEQIQLKNAPGQRIARWAIRLGERFSGRRRISPWYWIRLQVADLLVYRYWRQAIGGRVEGIMVGAAALQPRLGKLFSAAGIDIREGYGLTETSPVIAFNRFEPGGVNFGTVGIPVPGVEVKIHEPDGQGQGEVWVKGPNVMMGYYKLAELTKETITPDGWLQTGDVGGFVHKRFLKITDRKKDIFKSSSGKFIAPQHIESSLRSSPFIDQCMVVGMGRPYLTALIIPDFVKLKKWCDKHSIHWTSPQYMVLNPKVERLINKEVEKQTSDLPGIERVRKCYLLYMPWAVQSGEITPTLKLRRSDIAKKYAKEIESLYS